MNINAKYTEEDTGYGVFNIGGAAFPSICKRDQTIGYFLIVQVNWGKLLVDFMGRSSIKASGIHDGTMRVDSWLEDEMLDPLEGWS